MSYILDALKRAEHERSGALASAPTPGQAAGALNRLSPALLIGIGALLFAAGIAISWLLLRPAAAPEPVAAVAAPTAAATAAPLAVATPVAATAAPVADPDPLADESPISALNNPEDGELLADAVEIEPALAGYESLDDLTPVFQGIGAGAGTAKPADAAKPAGSAGGFTPTPATPAAPPPAPLLRDMPQIYRDQFPAPTVQVHVYNALVEKRWIMVDGKRLGQGSQLDSGPRIVEIAADGIVFDYRGEKVFWPLQR